MDKTNALSLRGGGMFDGGWRPVWLIKDEFTDTRAAGSVNGTAATPGPGTRTVTDTESKLSVSSGALAIAGGKASPAWGDPGLWMNGINRITGVGAISKIVAPAGAVRFVFGFSQSTSGEPSLPNPCVYLYNGTIYGTQSNINMGAYSAGQDYVFAIILRSTGAFVVAAGGAFSSATLLWVYGSGTTATLYPCAVNYNATSSVDYLRALALPAPFDTDTGLATDVHAGSVSAGTTFEHQADCLIEFTVTTLATSGYISVRFRYVDANNFWLIEIEGGTGSLRLYERVSGTYSQRGFAASAVSDGTRIVAIAENQSISVYADNTKLFTYANAANFATATVGLTGNLGPGGAVSDLITWPRQLSGTAAAILNKASAAYPEPEKTTLTLYTTKSGTFNPTIVATGDPGVYWDFGDGSTYIGLTPNHSYADGSQKTVTIMFDDPSLVTRLNFSSQSMTGEWPLSSLADFTALTQLVAYTNASLNVSGSLADAPAAMTYLHLDSTSSNITGSLADALAVMTDLFLGGTSSAITGGLADAPAAMTNLQLHGTSSAITGSLADAPAGMTSLILYSTSSNITGSLADAPAPMTQLQLHGTSSAITGGATAMAAVGIRQIRVDSSSTTQANINDILLRLYTDRASFTYATPSLNVGGTNPDPSGVYQDATPPTTGLEYAYKLVNDPDTEGFNTWTVTY
jgi:hypothetical protein